MLVVTILVMLIHVRRLVVVLFQPLTGAGGNLVLFVLVDIGNGRSGARGSFFARGALGAATTAATATPTTARIPLLTTRVLHAASSRGAIGSLAGGGFLHVDVVDPRQDIILLQIGIQVQIKVKFALARLLAADFIATRFFSTRRTVVATRSRWALVPTCRWRAFFAARGRRPVVSPWRWRALVTARGWRALIAARGRRSVVSPWRRWALVTAHFRPAALLPSLITAPSALAAVSFPASFTLVIARTRSLVAPRFTTGFGCLFLVKLFLIEVQLILEVRLNHFGMLFKIVVERKARVVLKAPGLRTLGLEGHAGLELVERIGKARRRLCDRPFEHGFFGNGLDRDRPFERPLGNVTRGWSNGLASWRLFGFGSGRCWGWRCRRRLFRCCEP